MRPPMETRSNTLRNIAVAMKNEAWFKLENFETYGISHIESGAYRNRKPTGLNKRLVRCQEKTHHCIGKLPE